MKAIHCGQLYSEDAIFSQGVVAEEFTFLSTDARDPDGSCQHDSPASECTRTLEALRIALNSCGQDLKNLVSLTVFLSDYSIFAEVAATLRSDLDSEATPAVTLVGVTGLEGGCRIRMDAIATHNSQ